MDIYYGKAAPYIAQYYNQVHSNVQKHGQPLYIYAQPDAYRNGYLSAKCLKEYTKILNDALEAVKGDRELTKRVRREMLGILYVKAKKISFNKKERNEALEEFYKICKENGITDIMEGNPDYLDKFYKKTKKQIKTVITPDKDTTVAISQAIKFGLKKKR